MTIRVALRSLIRNKLRTFLTMLGIIIGVGSVIGMIAIATGAKQSMNDRIEASGTNMIMIFASSGKRRGGVHFGMGSIQTMTPDDADAIMKYCKHVEFASPQIRTVVRIIYKNQNWSTAARAGNEYYHNIRNWKVDRGRFFSEAEVKAAAKVCVIGDVIRDKLFGTEDPIGKIIRVNRQPFRILGVMETKGQEGWGGSWDDVIIIPYTTSMRNFYNRNNIRMITASATDRLDINFAKDEITDLLRQRHRIRKGEEDDFRIRTQEDRLQRAEDTSKFLSLFLGAIASVSLLVGGIGIMNIMLVTVTERIREIGIRMAIGARRIHCIIPGGRNYRNWPGLYYCIGNKYDCKVEDNCIPGIHYACPWLFNGHRVILWALSGLEGIKSRSYRSFKA